MQRISAQSTSAQSTSKLVTDLQSQLVDRLEVVSRSLEESAHLVRVEWFRDQGRHGGGLRYEAAETHAFNRASVNVSQVQYEDEPQRPLASATALSAIVHPQHPRAASLHLHISWTELRSGRAYWRIMADLNPAIPQPGWKPAFVDCLQLAAGEVYAEAAAQGDRYFYIPTLQRHRGVAHFYLEDFHTDDQAADLALAERVGTAVIDTYARLLEQIAEFPAPDASELHQQLAYHTLYFFQVLTLDRGTTSGLLIHDQNDLGILGSLPARIDKTLLASWLPLLPEPQDQLLAGLLQALPDGDPSPIDETVKLRLAQIVRSHYSQNPQALALQAAGQGSTHVSTRPQNT